MLSRYIVYTFIRGINKVFQKIENFEPSNIWVVVNHNSIILGELLS